MRVYQVDLFSTFQERRWRYLLNLIVSLPRNTSTQEALSQDDELIEQLMKNKPDDDESSRHVVRMRDFSPEVEAIYGVADRVGEVIGAVVASAGGKPKAVRPLPRPETAWTRLENKRSSEKHRALVARVLANE